MKKLLILFFISLALTHTDTRADEPVVQTHQVAQASEVFLSGVNAFSKGQYEAAIPLINKAISMGPKNHPDLWRALQIRGLAYTFQTKSDWKKGKADLDQAVKQHPAKETYFNRVAGFKYMGQFDLALADLKKAYADDMSADAHYAFGNLYVLQGKADLALQEYSKAIEINENHGRALRQRGLLKFLKGNPTEATKDLNDGVNIISAAREFKGKEKDAYMAEIVHDFSKGKPKVAHTLVHYASGSPSGDDYGPFWMKKVDLDKYENQLQ